MRGISVGSAAGYRTNDLFEEEHIPLLQVKSSEERGAGRAGRQTATFVIPGVELDLVVRLVKHGVLDRLEPFRTRFGDPLSGVGIRRIDDVRQRGDAREKLRTMRELDVVCV